MKRTIDKNNKVKPMGLGVSFMIFGIASAALILGTKYLIPLLSRITGLETVLFWFIVAGLGIFLPLLVTALVILKKEGFSLNSTVWSERLRFRKLNSTDIIWSVSAIVVIGLLSMLVMKGIEVIAGPVVGHQPPFMEFKPLSAGRYWLLLVWGPYWILNIMGEEIMWRGVMMPRQEVVFGKKAWLIYGAGWALFHIAFGWQLFLTLLPILFILPYVVQKQKNSWIAVIIHAVINGPSFIAIAIGLL